MYDIIPIPAFSDNYIWMLHAHGQAAVVDPGNAEPVLQQLATSGLQLHTILVTHHHNDHIGGVEKLQNETGARVYAPARENYAFPHHPVQQGDQVSLDFLPLTLSVIEVPGHTLGHVAYYGAKLLFCGDTLFSAGCGRLFEGTPAQMLDSLNKLAALPAETAVYCTHEYTEHNLKFARQLDPANPALLARQAQVTILRQQGLPSLPSTLAIERDSNPFLRCTSPAIQQASGIKEANPLAVFTAIREMRNHF
jgi:hydroxyacylglutathione hydrolase